VKYFHLIHLNLLQNIHYTKIIRIFLILQQKSFVLTSKTFITLSIYDALGREVIKLINGIKDAGIYKMNFDAGDLPSGIYYYRLRGGDFSQTRKMLLMK